MEKTTLKLKSFLPLLLLILFLGIYYSTCGTFDIFQNAYLGSAFDALGEHLLQFQVDLSPDAIGKEAFIINGNYYMYFGPFPAFLRIVWNAINSSLYGQWTCFSKLCAYALFITGIAKILLLALNLNHKITEKIKINLFALSIISFAFATTFSLVLIHNAVYAESISWGLNFASWGIYFYLRYSFIDSGQERSLIGLSVCTGLAFLARVTFALPFFYCWGVLVIKNIIIKKIQWKNFVCILLPLILALSFQLWYNFKRFGSVLDFYNQKYYGNAMYIRSHKRAILEKLHTEKLFHIKRIPEAARNYFGITKEVFTQEFPFVRFNSITVNNPEDFIYLGVMFPFPLVAIWLILPCCLGLFFLLRSNLARDIKLMFFLLLTEVFMILMCTSMDYRYSAEFLPALIYLYFFYVLDFGKIQFQKGTIYFVTKVLICLLAIYITVFSALYKRAYFSASEQERSEAWSLIRHTDEFIHRFI